MLYKEFGNLPYESLCVSSIVKRAVSHLHMIAMDFERRLQLMVAARTRRGKVRIGPDDGSVVSAFLAGADAFRCASMCEMPRDAWGDGTAMVGGRRWSWTPTQLTGQGRAGQGRAGHSHGETIPIPDFESHLHLASFVSRADASELFSYPPSRLLRRVDRDDFASDKTGQSWRWLRGRASIKIAAPRTNENESLSP